MSKISVSCSQIKADKTYTLDKLKKIADEYGISKSGTKEELCNRIKTHEKKKLGKQVEKKSKESKKESVKASKKESVKEEKKTPSRNSEQKAKKDVRDVILGYIKKEDNPCFDDAYELVIHKKGDVVKEYNLKEYIKEWFDKYLAKFDKKCDKKSKEKKLKLSGKEKKEMSKGFILGIIDDLDNIINNIGEKKGYDKITEKDIKNEIKKQYGQDIFDVDIDKDKWTQIKEAAHDKLAKIIEQMKGKKDKKNNKKYIDNEISSALDVIESSSDIDEKNKKKLYKKLIKKIKEEKNDKFYDKYDKYIKDKFDEEFDDRARLIAASEGEEEEEIHPPPEEESDEEREEKKQYLNDIVASFLSEKENVKLDDMDKLYKKLSKKLKNEGWEIPEEYELYLEQEFKQQFNNKIKIQEEKKNIERIEKEQAKAKKAAEKAAKEAEKKAQAEAEAKRKAKEEAKKLKEAEEAAELARREEEKRKAEKEAEKARKKAEKARLEAEKKEAERREAERKEAEAKEAEEKLEKEKEESTKEIIKCSLDNPSCPEGQYCHLDLAEPRCRREKKRSTDIVSVGGYRVRGSNETLDELRKKLEEGKEKKKKKKAELSEGERISFEEIAEQQGKLFKPGVIGEVGSSLTSVQESKVEDLIKECLGISS